MFNDNRSCYLTSSFVPFCAPIPRKEQTFVLATFIITTVYNPKSYITTIETLPANLSVITQFWCITSRKDNRLRHFHDVDPSLSFFGHRAPPVSF